MSTFDTFKDAFVLRFEIPSTHVGEHRVRVTPVEKTPAGETISPLIRIQSSAEKSGDAFVTVPYRNAYSRIDDRAVQSKRIFSNLTFSFTLKETGEQGDAPVCSGTPCGCP